MATAPAARPAAWPSDHEPIAAFTARQVAELTGLTQRQLCYWDRTGLVHPSYTIEGYRGPHDRIYLYRDVVSLRTIGILRNEHHVPLQQLRKVGQWLKKHYSDPWWSLRLYVIGKRVHFEDPTSGLRRRPHDQGQIVLSIEMAAVELDTRERALRLRERSPEEIGHITRHRHVESNAWALAGTRVPTEAVWEFHEAGYDTPRILAAYPALTPLDVERAIDFERKRRKQRAG